MSNYKEIEACRVCGNTNLIELFALDPQHLSPTFVESNIGNSLSAIKVPLTLLMCSATHDHSGCGLVQLKETTDPNLLYTNYFYRSATNSTMLLDLKKVVDKVSTLVNLKSGDIVVDVGANDGSLLSFYERNLKRVGVEPAQNIDWSKLDPKILMINDFFGEKALKANLGGCKVKIFTCCAMFYDLDRPNDFVRVMKDNLAEDGVLCIQLSYILSMLENMNFYDICHEHLEYYSINALSILFEKNDLRIFDLEVNDVNGGSAIVFVSHSNSKFKNTKNVSKQLEIENSSRLNEVNTYKVFHRKLLALKELIYKTIKLENQSGGYVVGLGASTKGNVLLQFFNLTKDVIPFIGEINDTKIGLRTLGSDIPIISDLDLNKKSPTLKLVLPWYFKDEIVKRESAYLASGGKLLFPMPYPHIVTAVGEIKL